MNKLEQKITISIQRSGRHGLSARELYNRLGKSAAVKKAVKNVLNGGKIIEHNRKLYLLSATGGYKAVVERVSKTFGFVRREDETSVFVPGKYFKGALVGDEVLVKPIKSSGDSDEGEIIAIIKKGDGLFTGTLKYEQEQAFVIPDDFGRFGIIVMHNKTKGFLPGSKVLAKVIKRGERHSEHMCTLVQSFGSSQSADACAKALLAMQNIQVYFPDDVQTQAAAIDTLIDEKEILQRTDLRDKLIFTIDSSDAMDLDDAISLEHVGDNYILGVHIADVSHYITRGTPLDREALYRGTSIYYPGHVVPMLPKELSNGVCSLMPNEDKLTFSALLTISKDGKLIDFKFEKTIIKSVVKGVYSEINDIFAGNASEDIKAKYARVTAVLMEMNKISHKMNKIKADRGALSLHSTESKVTLTNKVAVSVAPRTGGEAEELIENFMLTANQACATTARTHNISFIYRVHEKPPEGKIETLKTELQKLGITDKIDPDTIPQILAEISSTDPHFTIINKLCLQAMSKAKYSAVPLGHYGLALSDYTHFTSPIRRYPDLLAHRVLYEFLCNGSVSEKYKQYIYTAATVSTNCEIKAANLERDITDFYKAEYMQSKIGEKFSGIISGISSFGIYVELPNTVEGMIRTDSLPAGEYIQEGNIRLTEAISGKTYTVGDKIDVICSGSDVPQGRVDFA